MTPERIEQERAKFEKNIHELGITSYKQRLKSGEYAYEHIEFAWKMWQARAAQSEWISVEEGLPKINTYVLAVTHRGLVISDRVCDYGRGKEWVSGHSDNPITHWQLLPEPPAGGAK